MSDSSPFDAYHAWQEFGVDQERRRVMFHHGMERASADYELGVEHVVRNLLWLDRSTGPIELWVNCEGGYIFEMWGVHDVLRQCRARVETVGFGSVASAACLILAAGTGRRYVTPNSSFMWHQGTAGGEGLNQLDAQQRAAFEVREFELWLATMARYTKRSATYWRNASRGELWLDAREMIRHGIADKVWR
jgi:ATP-dependent Clp protease protease subunit